ncbi:MAG: hypothetical protein KGO82_09695 [Bacteroidota bacterium]|nr:hypothetical protein [Bacteroidota bacterium]
MCNCASKRQDFSIVQSVDSSNQRVVEARTWPEITFMYTGQTAMTAVGRATGRSYRFRWPGDRQSVDFRDVPGMAGVTVLRRV